MNLFNPKKMDKTGPQNLGGIKKIPGTGKNIRKYISEVLNQPSEFFKILILRSGFGDVMMNSELRNGEGSSAFEERILVLIEMYGIIC